MKIHITGDTFDKIKREGKEGVRITFRDAVPGYNYFEDKDEGHRHAFALVEGESKDVVVEFCECELEPLERLIKIWKARIDESGAKYIG